MIELSAEQRAAVEDRAGPLLLSANAGSGKTSVLVERVVAAVREDDVDLGAILAITFTEKAAAELRARVRGRFAELGDHEHAREAERAAISTIHGWCARLLRTHPIAAGLDPAFEVLDEREADRLADAAYEAALGDVLDGGGEEALDGLAPYFADALRALVRFAHDALRVRGEEHPELPEAPPPRDFARARDDLAAAARAVEAPVGADCETFLAELGDRVPARVELAALDLRNGRSEESIAYREALEAVRRACWEREAARTYRWLRELVRVHGERYAALKARRGGLDFADLELRALALLSENGELRERESARWAHVMVDEFQDTNPVQLRLLDLVAADRLFAVGDEFQSIYGFRHADVQLFRELRARREAEGRARVLARNHRGRAELLDAINLAFAENLFGEGFVPLVPADEAPRDGEPPVEVLVCEKKGWEETDLGEGLPEATAWRRVEARAVAARTRELLDGGRLPGEIVILLRASTDMAVFAHALEDQGVPTYLVGGRGYWSQREVGDVVAYLAALANPRDDLRIYEVLASPMVGISSDALTLVGAAARLAGVPAALVVQRAVGSHLPTASAQGMLFDADAAPGIEPVGELAPAAAELAVALPVTDRDRLAVFLKRFEGHRAAAPRTALDALVDRVVRDTGYDLALLRRSGGERLLANVRKLMRLAREHEEREGRDLRALVDRVGDLADAASDREAEAPVESETALEDAGLGAVRLMTIHRAKGLEFPIVFLADLGREPPRGARDRIRLGPDGEVGVRIPAPEGNLPAFAWEELGEAAQRAGEAEERRLAYVAMTRARERLLLSGALDTEAWGQRELREPLAELAAALVPGLPEGLDAAEPDRVAERSGHSWSARIRCRYLAPASAELLLGPGGLAPRPLREAAPDAAAASPAPAPPPAPAPAPAPVSRLSYSALEGYARCSYRFYLQRVLGLPDEAPPGSGREGALPALVRGELAHAALERLDLASPEVPSPGELEALAAERGTTLSVADAARVGELVGAFATSELRARVGEAGEVRREAAFGFTLAVGDAEVLMTGALDLLARDGDEVLVVDYKTDRVPGDADLAALVERDYGVQRLVYGLAALRGGASSVEVVHCFLERASEPVSARFEAPEAPLLEEQLAALAAAALAGRYPVTDTPHRELCLTCPGRAELCSWPQDVTLRPASEVAAISGA